VKNAVVITGVGLVSPVEPFMGVDIFWNALCSGEDAIKKVPPPVLDMDREWLMAGIDMSGGQAGLQSECPEDKLHILAEEALSRALMDANLQGDLTIGLSIGTVLGNILLKEKRLIRNKGGNITGETERESLSYINSFLKAKYDLKGQGISVSTACSSGTDAIGIAARKIMSGRSDIMIAGGVDVLSDFAVIGFHSLQALTEKKVQPFDKNRSGLAIGEGAAFIVLEAEEKAVKRGARVYGKVLGYASRADAHHLTGPHREGRGLADAINEAMFQANLKPHGIHYINAHGTGTVYNDLMETKAIKASFGDVAYNIPISSTKSMLGHSFGAAGVIEAICCLLSIKTKIIHPTINFEERDPECDLDYVPNKARQQEVKIAMSLSAGFGGQNSAIIFGES
jgi:3-oxoacyl-[acyl-carrier-protein] synthase II